MNQEQKADLFLAFSTASAACFASSAVSAACEPCVQADSERPRVEDHDELTKRG
jgi:hypothetical protein